MPNTLCHFAIQGPTNRLISKQSALPWILTGCILPDIPWIIQRLLLPLHIFNPYDVRLYVTVQASLFFCLLLALALALLTEKTPQIFALLGGNCLFHLLLDTIEIKWGNGVHLFAPITWRMIQFNILWSENPLFTIGSVAGILYIVFSWKKAVAENTFLHRPSWIRTTGILVCLLIYLLAPFHFMQDLEKANNRYIHTLRDTRSRAGKFIEFDRVHYSEDSHSITTFAGEKIALQGHVPKATGLISLQGTFLSKNVIAVVSFHIDTVFRALASYIGLFLFLLLWWRSLLGGKGPAKVFKDIRSRGSSTF